jgi:hypothetical protein
VIYSTVHDKEYTVHTVLMYFRQQIAFNTAADRIEVVEVKITSMEQAAAVNGVGPKILAAICEFWKLLEAHE